MALKRRLPAPWMDMAGASFRSSPGERLPGRGAERSREERPDLSPTPGVGLEERPCLAWTSVCPSVE